MATAQTPDVAMPLKGLTGMYGDPGLRLFRHRT